MVSLVQKLKLSKICKTVSRTNLGLFYVAAPKIMYYLENNKFSKFGQIAQLAKARVSAKCRACTKKWKFLKECEERRYVHFKVTICKIGKIGFYARLWLLQNGQCESKIKILKNIRKLLNSYIGVVELRVSMLNSELVCWTQERVKRKTRNTWKMTSFWIVAKL